jgi:hypothetical protein
MRDLIYLTGTSFITSLLVLAFTNFGLAQVMTSSNYQIQSDSVNFNGGYSSSTSYQLESTAGEVATGELGSASYAVRAGYQQMQESYIALSADGNVSLSPSIPGISGGTATGSTTVTVTTDSLAGYELTIQASDSPAMQSGANTIADYIPGGSDPDFDFTIGASDAYFGFSPEGADIVQKFLDNGSTVCNQMGGSDTSDKCWDGLTTSPVNIAVGSGSNHPSGVDTVIQFQVGIGGSVIQPAGSYVATTTITATSL